MKHKNSKNITSKKLKQFSKKFNKTRTNKVLKNVNTKGYFENLIVKSDYLQNKKRTFKNMINTETKITDQHHSGRCWIFAFLNVIRIPMIKKYKLKDFIAVTHAIPLVSAPYSTLIVSGVYKYLAYAQTSSIDGMSLTEKSSSLSRSRFSHGPSTVGTVMDSVSVTSAVAINC